MRACVRINSFLQCFSLPSPPGYKLDIKKTTHKKVRRTLCYASSDSGSGHYPVCPPCSSSCVLYERLCHLPIPSHPLPSPPIPSHPLPFPSIPSQLSSFLEAMSGEGVLKVEEVSTGVDAVTSVELRHPMCVCVCVCVCVYLCVLSVCVCVTLDTTDQYSVVT